MNTWGTPQDMDAGVDKCPLTSAVLIYICQVKVDPLGLQQCFELDILVVH